MSPPAKDDATVTADRSMSSAADSTVGPEQATPAEPAELPRFAPPTVAGELGRLGKYRVQKELGRGGMGAVYLAFDERLERQVALKVMLPRAAANPTAKDRFLREARSAARVTSDYVVAIHEADEIDGTPYIALQFLQGYPLDEYLKRKGTPSIPQAMRIGRETALGLAAAHKLGLVHRDIKPGNLWLEAPGGRVKVLDFGLAKPVNGTELAELTASGAVVGTPSYMAPEQGMGKPLDGRADLFSLGCVLYRLVTGRLPFERPTLMAILTAIATEEPTPVREVNPAVPERLAHLIHKLMAKKPDQRPQSAKDVADELALIATPPRPAVSPDAPTVAPQPVFVPIAVSVQQPNPFANLSEPSDDEPDESREVAAPPKKPRKFPVALVGGLFAGLLAVVAAGVIIIKITNKDGTVTEVKVPDDAKIEVDGKTVKPEPKKPTVKPTPPDTPPVNASPPTTAAGLPAGKSGLRFTMGDMAVATNVPVRPTTVVTVEAWVNFEVLQEVGGRDLIGTPNGTIKTGDNRLNFYTFHGAADAKDVIPKGRRVHVAAVNDGKKRYLYLDGKRIAESADAGEPIPENEQRAGGDKLTRIALGSDHFTGIIDAVRVSTTAKYEKEFTPPDAFAKDKDTYALYLFDEGQGDTLNDSSGNGYHAKISGAKWVKGEGAAADDRKTAEWVLSHGGQCTVRANDTEKLFKANGTLPSGPLELVGVEIVNENSTDESAGRVAGLPKLRLLTLLGGSVTDDGIAKLRDLPRLDYLNLHGSKVTDAGLPALKQLPELRKLILINTKVSDGGLAALKELPKLQCVVLDETAVTDDGLLHLGAMPGLTEVMVLRTKVTEAGVKKLAAALPKCKIEYDGGVIEPAKK